MKTILPLLVAALAVAAPAAANDSTATVAAGGLVLTRSDDIAMLSEDLFVSAGEVRVRYVFRNRAARDIRTVVAFPLPGDDLAARRLGDVAFPRDFRTRVDGRPVAMAVERKAMLGTTDHSALLAGLGVPLFETADAGQGGASGIGAALDRLPQAQARRLIRLGLAAVDEYDVGKGMERHLEPLWTVRETWHWQQVFPAGRDLVVEHRYVPGTGGSVGTPLADRAFRASPEGRRMIAAYCADRSFLAGIDRLTRAGAGDWPTLPEERIGYILTTGANWAAPIGRFRLVVDKGAPANLVSFCGEGVRKISPTRFEMTRTHWRPDRDLDILIVKPGPAPQ